MKIINARQPLPDPNMVDRVTNAMLVKDSIFLAGPTPRANNTTSWRPEAIKHLEYYGHDGYVFVPEDDQWDEAVHHDAQVNWEIDALGRAAVTLFWIPRDLELLPGFTTNTEFGFMLALRPHRTVLGVPIDTPKTSYQIHIYKHFHRFMKAFDMPGDDVDFSTSWPYSDLKSACKRAVYLTNAYASVD